MTLMIYGAYGYTGELIVREAVRRRLRPIIAGRNASKLAALAVDLGLEYRTFPVEDASSNLEGVRTVLNCAGPFSHTAEQFTKACLAMRCHYVDVTGEIPVFEHCYGLDEKARSLGVILCPGAGFDVVPTDCLAMALKAKMPAATTLNLAFSFGTQPSIGTIKTTIEGLKQGGMVRREGKLVRVPDGYDLRRIPFPQGQRWAATVPYGDVFTAWVTTGIPNITVYSAAPLGAGIAMKLGNPLRRLIATDAVQEFLKRLVERKVKGGPDEKARMEQRTEFWGEAIDREGKIISFGFTAPNVYALTVQTALPIALHCLNQSESGGYYTPAQLMGSEFISSLAGVTAMTPDTLHATTPG